MIQELKFKNFLSFRDEVVFSFEATSDDTLDEYYVAQPVPGVRILKMAMVYGANASGKSNLLLAINFLKDFIQNIPVKREKSIEFIPFLFDNTCNEPGMFEMIFYAESVKYKYYLELDKEKVIKEVLSCYPGTQPATIFNREFDYKSKISVIKLGSKIKISDQAAEAIQLKTLKNMSVFAALSQVNLSLPELDIPYNWFKNKLLPPIDPYSNITAYSDEYIKDDGNLKRHALEFVKEADFNISNISFKEQVKSFTDEEISSFEETFFEHRILKDNVEEFHSLPDSLESRGTIRYYGLSAPFYHTIENSAFLPIDEISTSLHPLLVIHFIKEFLKKSDQAQLLFTTHNMSLLNERDLIRKDAVWFVEKGDDGSSKLYSLADFNFRKELSYYNAYKQGKFGAIPNLEEENLAKVVGSKMMKL
ncbi:MAG: ATP/GTP-binding protein [Bacteroidales bacterium]